jgi:hypothetical protein
MVKRTAAGSIPRSASKGCKIFWFAVVALVTATTQGTAATLMSFTQTNATQYVRFNDVGAASSTLTTWNGTTLGAAVDVNFTFLATNRLFSTGTTVAAKFKITATPSGSYSTFGSGPTATKLQPVSNLTFSFTNAAGTVNYLSGTSGEVFLTQMSSNTASMDIDFGGSGINMTSDAFVLNGATDATQLLALRFSPLTPTTFGDGADTDTYLDTVNMNIASSGNTATAVAGVVPEPGGAILLFATLGVGIFRRRR